jgi:cation diffusion facilitator CzcD-associated flavoprotein CzcO
VGGVWARLPAWQTVQNDPRDFCVQGFTTSKQTWHARDVVHMLSEYIRVGKLESYIRLGREVYSHEWDASEEVWVLKVRPPLDSPNRPT